MRFKCLIFGHTYQKISHDRSVSAKKELAKHEYNELCLYRCKHCGKEIFQEEHYQ